MRRFTVLFLLILTLILMACTGGDDDDSGGMLGLEGGPTPAVSLDRGLQTSTTFLNAWVNQDYNTMYGLISPNARDAFPQEEFTEIYQDVWQDLRLQSISWEQGDALLQGNNRRHRI